MYMYRLLLHNTNSECRHLSSYAYVTALNPWTLTLVNFSTRPLMSTSANISTQRGNMWKTFHRRCCASYLVNNEVHNCLGNNITLSLVNDLEVRVHQIANRFHLALQLWIYWSNIIFVLWHIHKCSLLSTVEKYLHIRTTHVVKKAEHLYSTLHGIQTTLKRSGIDHTVLSATNTMPALLRKHSPDGATTDWGGRHLIAAYCSFIDPERMKGWVGLVGWPAADGLPT